MVQKAGIENDKLRNHSGRKKMIKTLSEHDIPPTQIFAQLSGHKNFKSIENDSTVSTKQQMQMSKVLSRVVAGTSTSSSSQSARPVRRPRTPRIGSLRNRDGDAEGSIDQKVNLYFTYESRDTLKSFTLFITVKTIAKLSPEHSDEFEIQI